MKSVIYIRHAKSSWKDPLLDDFDRPLNKRGLRDAPIMAEKLVEREGEIDGIISSPSVRTKMTLKYFADAFDLKRGQIKYDANLYHPYKDYLQESLISVDEDWDRLLIFTHNPGITQFINDCRQGDIENVPTTGIVRVDYNIKSWKDIYSAKGTVNYFMYPKMYINA